MPTVTAILAEDGRAIVTLEDLPVVATPLPATPWTLYRTDGLTEVPVRAAEQRPLTTSPGTVVVDREYPLSRPFAYVVRYTTSAGEVSASSAFLAADEPLPLISEPVTGASAAVTVVSWPARSRAGRSSALSVDGRRSPYVVVGRMSAYEGSVTLRTIEADQAQQLAELLDHGSTLLLRAVDLGVPDTYVLVGSVTETRLSNRAGDPRRLWELTVTEVEMPDPAIESLGSTLGDLADAYPPPATLSTISATYPSLLAIAQDDLA